MKREKRRVKEAGRTWDVVAKGDWDFRISNLLKNSDETDIKPLR